MVIPLNEQQFERYSKFRIEKEKALVNQAIVGLNDERQCFMLGMIEDRANTGHQYKIKWADGKSSIQKEEHLFGALTRRDQHRKDSYVLAMDAEDNVYKFARTLAVYKDDHRLNIQFLDIHRANESSDR